MLKKCQRSRLKHTLVLDNETHNLTCVQHWSTLCNRVRLLVCHIDTRAHARRRYKELVYSPTKEGQVVYIQNTSCLHLPALKRSLASRHTKQKHTTRALSWNSKHTFWRFWLKCKKMLRLEILQLMHVCATAFKNEVVSTKYFHLGCL